MKSNDVRPRGWILVVLLVVLGLLAGAFFFFFRYNRSDDSPIPVTIIHPFSFSNAAVFLATLDKPKYWDRRAVADTSKHAEILKAEGDQHPIITVTPFTNALIVAATDKSIRIIGGAGLNGLYLVARDISDIRELENKKIGTARADSLELMLYELLKPMQYQTIYFDDPFVAVESLKKGELNAVTHVEPFVTQLLADTHMRRLKASRDLWGDHPDAVLMTTRSVLLKYPREIERAMNQLQTAESKVNSNPRKTVAAIAPLYAPMVTPLQLEAILPTQPARIDIRSHMQFFRDRFKTLQELKYVPRNVDFPEDAFDFSFLSRRSG